MRTLTFGLVLVLASVGSQAQGRPGGSDCRTPGHGRSHFVEAPRRLPASVSDEPAGTSSTDVNLVDVDGDGDVDIFLVEGTDSLDGRPNELFINKGRGWFADGSSTRLPQGSDANSTKADFADVDGDGDLDAIVANVGPDQLLLNDGDGYFWDGSEQLPEPPDLFDDISSSAHFGDVNQDACPDILIANENPFDPDLNHGAQNRLWINDCTGHFSDETADRLPAATDQSALLLAGDIDADGDQDIVVLDRGPELIYINDGMGYFDDETSARIPFISDSTRGGALVDVDLDGTLDLVTANSRGEPPQLYLNGGSGVFMQGVFEYTEAADQTDTDLQVVDLNCDRYPDLFITNAGRFDAGHGFEGGPDHFFENHWGQFSEATAVRPSIPADLPSTAAAFGDLDGDGDVDLVLAVTGDGELGRERIFLQQGRRRHGRQR